MGFNVVRLVSNGGHTAAPGAVSVDPVLATGQKLADAVIGANHTATVVAGKSYAVTADATGAMLLGLADSTVAANVMWVVSPNQTVIIHIPIGYTSLHYSATVNTTTIYLREIYRNPSNL